MKPCFEMQYLTNTNIYARPVIFMSENQLSDTKRQNINDHEISLRKPVDWISESDWNSKIHRNERK